MLRRFWAVTVLVWVGAGAAAAEVTVRRGEPTFAVVTPTAPPVQSPAFGDLVKSVAPGGLLAVPWFEVDTTNASGVTTLFAVRNESATTTTVTVTYFSTDGSQSYAEELTIIPTQTRTRNLRDVVPGRITADVDGVIRGWARLEASGGASLSHDIFHVDPAGNFAGGEVMANPSDGDLCARMRGRFMIGGGFSGGTRLLVLVDLPLGPDPITDAPTITGSAYTEGGTKVNDFQVWTADYAFELDAADLVDGATSFGSLTLEFGNTELGFLGGTVLLEANAEGRYSVTFRGTCLP